MEGFIIYSKKHADLSLQTDYSVMRLLEAASAKGIDIKVLTPNQFELVVTRGDKKSILIDDKTTSLPNFVIPRTGSGTTFYAFSVIRQLENLGVYVCNGADSISCVKDKLLMHQRLAHSELPTPKTMLSKYPIDINVVKREIGFPLVIKNVSGSYGDGIHLCKSEDSFVDILELIYSNSPHANIILQEFVERSYGRDLRAFVLGGRVIACMQRKAQNGFKANFSKGSSVSQFEITPEIEWLAAEAAKLSNLDIAGVDLLFTDDGLKICEVNSAPQFKGLEQVVGKHIAEDILNYIIIRTGNKVNLRTEQYV